MNKKEYVLNKLANCQGKIGFYYKNLVTNETITLNAEDEFLSASVIKLPMFAAIMKKFAENEADLNEEIAVTEESIMPSSGALNLFEKMPTLDIKTLCNLMIALSDNTATNILMNRYGIDELNRIFKEIGFNKSHIERLLFDSNAAQKGLENYVVPKELGDFLEKLYTKSFIDEYISDEIINVLKKQKVRHKLQGLMAGRFVVAHKTGEDNGITNDVGIVYSEEPFVIVFLSNNTDVGETEKCIREIALELTKIDK